MILELGEAQSASKPTSRSPITATIIPTSIRISGGAQFQLRVIANIARGFYAYANSNDDRFAPLQLTFDLPPTLELAGDPSYPPATAVVDGRSIYLNKVEIIQPLRLREDAAMGTHELIVRLQYQVCNDLSCWPPDSLDLSLPVVVKSGG